MPLHLIFTHLQGKPCRHSFLRWDSTLDLTVPGFKRRSFNPQMNFVILRAPAQSSTVVTDKIERLIKLIGSDSKEEK